MLYDLVHLYNDLGICVTAYYLTGSTPLTIFYIIINRLGYLYKFYVDSMIKKKRFQRRRIYIFVRCRIYSKPQDKISEGHTCN